MRGMRTDGTGAGRIGKGERMARKEKPKPLRRVRFVYDEDARFEECNGELRPLTEEEYAENFYRACPDHMRAGSKALSSNPNDRGCAECGRPTADWIQVPYEEYLAYYGNPERHVYLGVEVEVQCPCCKVWGDPPAEDLSSVWGIDFMDDAPELDAITIGEWMPAEDAVKLLGYAGDVVRDLLA